MSMVCSTVIIGIGSPHGDDQFGWVVIDELATMDSGDAILRKINSPVDLIPELETYNRVILVDASIGLPRNEPFLKLMYMDAKDHKLIREMPGRSTHDIGLYLTLRMAESLGKRTDHVILWIGHGETFDKMSEMSSATSMAASECATTIAMEMCDARNVAC